MSFLYDISHQTNRKIVEELKFLFKEYKRPLWLKWSVLHSVVTLLKVDLNIPYRRESILAEDGTELNIDWLETDSQNAPVVVVIPGITGHSRSPYLQHLVMSIHKKGCHVATLNHPGIHKDDFIKQPRYFSAHDVQDIEFMINHVHSQYPNTLLVFAYSLGACMLVKYLGNTKNHTPVTAAFSVSNPWDIPSTLYRIRTTFVQHNIFNRHFASVLCDMFLRNRKVLMEAYPHLDEKKILSVNCLDEFTKHASIHVFGYKDANDYYKDCSCIDSVPNISIPLMVIHAMDDPIVPEKAIPWDSLKKNKNIVVAITKSGGHSGWLEGIYPFNRAAWIDRIAIKWINAVLKTCTKD